MAELLTPHPKTRGRQAPTLSATHTSSVAFFNELPPADYGNTQLQVT